MAGEVDWAGVMFHPLWMHDGRFFRAPGLYALVRHEPDAGRLMLLAGEAENLASLAGPRHRLWSEALRLGVNELHLSFPIPRRVDRLALLARIVRHVQPILNVVADAHPEPGDAPRAICA